MPISDRQIYKVIPGFVVQVYDPDEKQFTLQDFTPTGKVIFENGHRQLLPDQMEAAALVPTITPRMEVIPTRPPNPLPNTIENRMKWIWWYMAQHRPDIKEAHQAHDDFLEGMLQKIPQSWTKKRAEMLKLMGRNGDEKEESKI